MSELCQELSQAKDQIAALLSRFDRPTGVVRQIAADAVDHDAFAIGLQSQRPA